jgi:hypothetical protein
MSGALPSTNSFLIRRNLTADGIQQTAVALPDGRIFAFFADGGLSAASISPAGVPGGPVLLATGTVLRPDAAVLSDGRIVVAWCDNAEVRAIILSADGTPIGGTFQVNVAVTSFVRTTPPSCRSTTARS